MADPISGMRDVLNELYGYAIRCPVCGGKPHPDDELNACLVVKTNMIAEGIPFNAELPYEPLRPIQRWNVLYGDDRVISDLSSVVSSASSILRPGEFVRVGPPSQGYAPKEAKLASVLEGLLGLLWPF